jgi:hypothetical protein
MRDAIIGGMPAVVFNRDTYDLPLLLFEQLAVERRLARWRHQSWRTAEAALGDIADVAFSYDVRGEAQAVRIERAEAIALVSLDRHGHVDVWLAATDEQTLDRLHDDIQGALPVAPDSESGHVPVRFWTLQGNEPQSVVRNVSTPAWADIRGNYPAPVVAPLERLMALEHPPHGGQLMLWHGRTGTGKTHAIRALLVEWRGWARAEYIVDPEQFFGGPAGYIMTVLLGGEEDEEPERQDKWRLLVVEDTGELLTADAKERVGQGLSRFLNTVDGLLGQGLKVLLLITTNEDLGKLHPAVVRPGRCAVNLRFTELEGSEAARWLARHGGDGAAVPGHVTLAELFAMVEEREVPQAPTPGIGFRRQ